MKRTVPFEIFGPNQHLMFDIRRLAVLEDALKKPISEVIDSQNVGVSFALTALPIAMSQHYRNADFATMIEDYLDKPGTSFNDIAVPLVKALLASGLLGKAVADRAAGIEVKDEPKNELATAEKPSKRSRNG